MNNSSKHLTAVLPVKTNSEKTARDLDRICLLLMPSFEKFWIDKEQLEFLIIVSPDEKNEIEKHLTNFTGFKTRIITDDELCPSLKSESGWYKQQILKLAAANVIQTEYFITLDADNILIKPISYDNLFRDNKPIFHKEIALYHWDWWLAGKEVLKNDVSIDERTTVIGATPEILYKDVCINLLRDIAIRNSVSDPVEFLFTISEKYNWTEYTLYWLYIMEKELVSEKYSQEDLMLYEGIWYSEASESEKLNNIQQIFQSSSALFMVPQSTLKIDPEKIKKIIFSEPGIQTVFSYYSLSAYLNKIKSGIRKLIKNPILDREKDRSVENRLALVNKPKSYLSDINYGEYSVLSTDPPVFYVAHWMNEDLKFLYSMEKIFNYFEGRSAYFLYAWCWHIDEPERVQLVSDFEKLHQKKYPEHRFIHLCNSISQLEAFCAAVLNAIFCNHNAFIDENIFKPLPGITKKYDAIYDARFKDYKRHQLATEIENLALLYEFNPNIDDLIYVEKVKKLCSKATILNNYNSTGYKKLSKEEVNLALNTSRVGLCLSRVEGAMYASIQYLLSGIPVVSTESKGGRDVFFEDDFVMIAEDNAHSVAECVKIMIDRNPTPEMIRAKTIDKMLQHRKRLIDTVQDIYNREGVDRDFASEWDALFFNKICKYQKHSDVIGFLENARSMEKV